MELNLVNCRQRLGCLLWGKRLTLAYSVEESDVFKIKDGDVLFIFFKNFLHTHAYNFQS